MKKIKRKSLLSISIVVFTLAITVFLTFIISTSNNKEQYINMIETQEVDTSKNLAEKQFENLNNTILYFSTMNVSDILLEEKNTYYFNKGIKENINMVFSTNDAVNYLMIMSNGKVFYNNFNSIQDYDFKAIRKITKTPETYLAIISSAKNDAKSVVLMADEKDENITNTVIIDLNRYIFAHSIFSEGEFSSRFIIDENGTIVFCTDSELLDENIYELYGKELKNMENGESFRFHDEKLLKYSTEITDTSLKIVSLTNAQRYANLSRQNTNTFILFAIITVVFSVACVFFTLFVTYSPIKTIISNIKSENFGEDYQISETEYIISAFENLKSHSEDLSIELAQAMEERNRVFRQQMHALQIQMCPHFIYNTLDIINWLAYKQTKDYENPITDSITKMSEILRKISDSSEQYVSVNQEIEYAKKYVDIIDIRYANKIKVKWDIDDEIRNCNIIKFCIQPIVENSCVHAFSDYNVETPEIKITIKQKDAGIRISVSDNGKGMSEDELKKLIALISNLDDTRNKHIGLWNLNYRLKILYGSNVRININSKRNEGTEFYFTIPKK